MKLPIKLIHYVDESGIAEFLYREYGYAPKGSPVYAKISGRKFKRLNIVAAKCCEKIVAPLIYDGTTDSKLFEFWFEECLLPELPKNAVIVMDNASFHRKAKLFEIIKNTSYTLLFLPPYSPDLNPIEKYWACLKRKLREILPQYDTLQNALLDCF